MIEVEIHKTKYFSPLTDHIRFSCPECSNDIMFVLGSAYYPSECKSCGYTKLPRMDHIMLLLSRRIGWHIYYRVGYKKDILLNTSRTKLLVKEVKYDDFEDKRGYD